MSFEDMTPVPKDIEVVMDFGGIDITTGSGAIHGNHMIVEWSEDAIKNWLRPFNGVWLGVGIPQMQEFEVVHVKD